MGRPNTNSCKSLKYRDFSIGYPCPFAKRMKEIIEKDLGDKVRFLDYTH
jgi:hypothetical protein